MSFKVQSLPTQQFWLFFVHFNFESGFYILHKCSSGDRTHKTFRPLKLWIMGRLTIWFYQCNQASYDLGSIVQVHFGRENWITNSNRKVYFVINFWNYFNSKFSMPKITVELHFHNVSDVQFMSEKLDFENTFFRLFNIYKIQPNLLICRKCVTLQSTFWTKYELLTQCES